MQPTSSSRVSSFLAWLDTLSDWRFTGTLYLLRWAVILPLALLLTPLATAADPFRAEGDPWGYLLPFLIVAPTLETLIECSLPYWIMHRWLQVPTHSPWPFVSVSAMVMVLLHPLTPVVVVMAFITGSFLAYVYAHFAPRNHAKAFLHTAVFHAGINGVGWTMLLAAQ